MTSPDSQALGICVTCYMTPDENRILQEVPAIALVFGTGLCGQCVIKVSMREGDERSKLTALAGHLFGAANG